MTQTILFANDKGGVQKTGVVVQTAAALARRGLNVLVVDTDPQANATRRLGIERDPTTPIPTVSEAIQTNVEGAGQGAVIACGWVDEQGSPTPESERIDVIPARFDLINRAGEAGGVGAVHRLKKALGGGWTGAYDVVLIDGARGLGHLMQMAMAAADVVVIPCDAGYESVEGAIRVRDFVAAHAEDLANPALTVAGVIVTRKRSTAEAEFQIEGVKERFGNLVWSLRTTRTLPGGVVQELTPDYIPEWTRFAEADAAAVSLSAWNDDRGRTTTALFDQVARNVVERIGQVPGSGVVAL